MDFAAYYATAQQYMHYLLVLCYLLAAVVAVVAALAKDIPIKYRCAGGLTVCLMAGLLVYGGLIWGGVIDAPFKPSSYSVVLADYAQWFSVFNWSY